MYRLKRILTPFLLVWAYAFTPAKAQTPVFEDVTVTRLGSVESGAVRLTYGKRLYYSTLSGDIYHVNLSGEGIETTLRYTTADHGLTNPWGMTSDKEDTIYLTGNEADGLSTRATIMKGVLDDPQNDDLARTWTVLAQTEHYPLSDSPYNHNFNGMTVSPDGQYLFVNSGSRTDHGELAEQGGNFPGAREVPLTAVILRLPVESENLILPNDSTALAPYIFARGVRNTFDLAFNVDGDLFGTENAGDRNDPEELNWIREGHHYGFPWRIGNNDTGQQFSDYDPATDVLINQEAYAWRNGFFYNDPTYPPAPAGITFTDPVPNLGPHADKFRNPTSGQLLDASDEAQPIYSFTSHRSPLGLVFPDNASIIIDAGSNIRDDFFNDGFMLSWTNSSNNLLQAMQDDGGDLLHLNLEKTGDAYTMTATQLVTGFDNPIDMVFDYVNKLYVIENGGSQGFWEVQLPLGDPVAVEPAHPAGTFSPDVFPNPVTDQATLQYRIERETSVQIQVYDMLGRLISTPVDEYQHPGQKEQVLNFGQMPPGHYLIRLATNYNHTYRLITRR